MPAPVDSTAAAFGIAPVQLPGQAPAGAASTPGTVSLEQSQYLMGSAMDSTSRIAQFHERMSVLRRGAMSRQQGAAATAALSQLDPTSPTYLQDRNDIIRRNPLATLDQSTTNFLGLQEDVYVATQQDLDEQADNEARGNYLQQKSQIEQQEDERKFMETELPEKPAIAQEAYNEARKQGVPHAQALIITGKIEKNENEILTMLEEGFTEEEVTGMLDDNGLMDPRKRAAAIGKRKRELEQGTKTKEKEKSRRILLEKQLEDLDDQRSNAVDEYGEGDPAELQRIDEEMSRVRAALGYSVPGLGAPGMVDPITGEPLTPTAQKPTTRVDALFDDA